MSDRLVTVSETSRESMGRASKVEFSGPLERPELGGVALDLSYPLLGHREYAHGSSMFEGMLAVLTDAEPELAAGKGMIRRFKVVRSFDTLATVVALETSAAVKHPRLKEIAARMDVEIDGRRLTSLLFPREESATGRLREYDPAWFLAEMDYGGQGGTVRRVADMVDLFRAVNECNRLLTLDSFPSPDWSPRVRFAYFENFPVLDPEACATVERVGFSSAEIVDLANHRFEIKRGELRSASGVMEFTICFFVELPGGDENES